MQPDDHLPATKADLREFATKADLRDFATKADLRDFATKADLREFATKADLQGLRSDVAGFAAEMRGLFSPMWVAVTRLQEDVADIRNHIKEKLVTRDEFHSRMDGYARRVEDHDYSSAKNLHRLDDHERRIRALEDKPS